jgi:hypothetical protein
MQESAYSRLDQLPGSPEAREAGCRCAVIDNHYGKGVGGDGAQYGWYVSADCPLHGGPGHYDAAGFWVKDGAGEG